MALSYIVYQVFTYWSKIANFFIPDLYLAPPYGVTPSEFSEGL